jgi:hypothetical protein
VPLQQYASSLQLLNSSGQHRHLELVARWASWYVELTWVWLLANQWRLVSRAILLGWLTVR